MVYITHFLWFLVGTIHISVLAHNHHGSHLLHNQNNFRNCCGFYVVSGSSSCLPTYHSRHTLNVPRETKNSIRADSACSGWYAALTLLWGVLWVSGQHNIQFLGGKLQFSAFWWGDLFSEYNQMQYSCSVQAHWSSNSGRWEFANLS